MVAADVYAHPPHVGRGGWTWYTGSAGWMYQAAVQECLGLRRFGRTLSLDPRIPSMWEGFTLTCRHGRAWSRISVSNAERRGVGVRSVTIDGVQVPNDAIPFEDDGQTHEIVVELGVPLTAPS